MSKAGVGGKVLFYTLLAPAVATSFLVLANVVEQASVGVEIGPSLFSGSFDDAQTTLMFLRNKVIATLLLLAPVVMVTGIVSAWRNHDRDNNKWGPVLFLEFLAVVGLTVYGAYLAWQQAEMNIWIASVVVAILGLTGFILSSIWRSLLAVPGVMFGWLVIGLVWVGNGLQSFHNLVGRNWRRWCAYRRARRIAKFSAREAEQEEVGPVSGSFTVSSHEVVNEPLEDTGLELPSWINEGNSENVPEPPTEPLEVVESPVEPDFDFSDLLRSETPEKPQSVVSNADWAIDSTGAATRPTRGDAQAPTDGPLDDRQLQEAGSFAGFRGVSGTGRTEKGHMSFHRPV